VLWAGGFHHESDYVLVFFIDKIYFDFGNLPVPHAKRHVVSTNCFSSLIRM